MLGSVWMWSFTATFIFINNSAMSRQRGTRLSRLVRAAPHARATATANGIGQSLVSIGRIIGPLVGGSMFAATASSALPWPLDYHFAFHAAGVMYVVIVGMSFALDDSIEKKNPRTE